MHLSTPSYEWQDNSQIMKGDLEFWCDILNGLTDLNVKSKEREDLETSFYENVKFWR
jgi:hypothetical protein